MLYVLLTSSGDRMMKSRFLPSFLITLEINLTGIKAVFFIDALT